MEHPGALKAGVLTSGEAVGNEPMLSRASIGRSSLDCLRPGMDSTRNSRIPGGIGQRGHPLGTVGKGLNGTEREGQMERNIFKSIIATLAPNECANAADAPLNETECTRLRMFVARLGDRVIDDTSLFNSMERNQLLFLRWLRVHGKLSW
jgi:hypothetical protein